MYPLVVLLGSAAVRRDIGVWRYGLPLSVIGLAISVEADVGYRYVCYGSSVYWALSFCVRIHFDPDDGWQRVPCPHRANAAVETA